VILFSALVYYNSGYLYGGGGTTGHAPYHGPCMDWLYHSMEIYRRTSPTLKQ